MSSGTLSSAHGGVLESVFALTLGAAAHVLGLRHGAQQLVLQRGGLRLQQGDRILVRRQPAGMADVGEVDQRFVAEIDRRCGLLLSRLPVLGLHCLLLLPVLSHHETATPFQN